MVSVKISFWIKCTMSHTSHNKKKHTNPPKSMNKILSFLNKEKKINFLTSFFKKNYPINSSVAFPSSFFNLKIFLNGKFWRKARFIKVKVEIHAHWHRWKSQIKRIRLSLQEKLRHYQFEGEKNFNCRFSDFFKNYFN